MERSFARLLLNRTLAWVVCAVVAMISLPGRADDDAEGNLKVWRAELLTQAGVDLKSASVLRFLRDQSPSEELSLRINRAVANLGANRYAVREAASRELKQIGSFARPELEKAVTVGNAETKVRARFLLDFYDATDDVYHRDMLILAAFDWLREYPSAEVPEVLYSLKKFIEKPMLRNAFRRALWASADASHREMFEEALQSESALILGASLVGLEIAVGEEAVETILPKLKHASPEVRLDAARALDSRRPQLAAERCAALLTSPSTYARVQSRLLLARLTGKSVNIVSPEEIADWEKHVEAGAGQWNVQPLGAERLEIRSVGLVLAELFDTPAESFTDSYRAFSFEGPKDTFGVVNGGSLELHSRGVDVDQRLAVTPSVLTGEPLMPPAFTVHTKMGGSADGSGVYHVGVSIGKVKVLFHPGYTGGGFRVEHVDTHQSILPNTSMGFNPGDRQVYDTTIQVRDRGGDSIEFRVKIRDHGKGGRTFERVSEVSRAVCGPIDRIGLERSGRAGGPAIFSELQIVVDE
ncbi:MAG: hypothetical protein NXI22_20265 [bacterium]|nr:hypothetical protein [bacterium]